MNAATARLRPWVFAPGWLTLSILVLLYPLFPLWFQRYQFVPFLVGLVFLGLPHGAMDHLVVPHLKRRPLTPSYLGTFILGYAALVFLYLGLWHRAPAGALILFLLLSWLHWGEGDAYALRVFAGRAAPASAASLWLIWAVRGALPIILPPLQFPSYFRDFAQGMLQWYAPAAPFWQITPSVQAAGLVLLISLIGLYLFLSRRENGRDGRKAFGIDAAETALLFVLFSRVPPILAVGVYFCVWHSWRHIARLMLADPATEGLLAVGEVGRSLRRTALQSLPMTLGALTLLGGLYVTRGHRATSAGDFVYLYLSLIAALTFPHFLLVLWMDRRQGIWTVKHRNVAPAVMGTAPGASPPPRPHRPSGPHDPRQP